MILVGNNFRWICLKVPASQRETDRDMRMIQRPYDVTPSRSFAFLERANSAENGLGIGSDKEADRKVHRHRHLSAVALEGNKKNIRDEPLRHSVAPYILYYRTSAHPLASLAQRSRSLVASDLVRIQPFVVQQTSHKFASDDKHSRGHPNRGISLPFSFRLIFECS